MSTDTMTYTLDEIAFQALIYRHVSQLLRYPNEESALCATELSSLFDEQSEEYALAMQMAHAAETASQLELERDYTALFIGALKVLAVPYASYYLDGAHQLYGPSTVEIEKIYARCGLAHQPERTQPADHIATMLEFLYVLLRNALAADADERESYVVRAQRFYRRFVAPWVPEFASSICSFAKTKFYRSLGEILPLVLIEDSLLIGLIGNDCQEDKEEESE